MSVTEYTMSWPAIGDSSSKTFYREEREDSPEEELSQDGSSATRSLFTSWRTRVQATKNFLGTTNLVNDGVYRYASRATPNPHPDYSINPFPFGSGSASSINTGVLYAESLRHRGCFPDSIRPKGSLTDPAGGAAGAFLESNMTVKYVSYPYTILEDAQMILLGASVSDGAEGLLADESSCLRYVWGILQASPKWQTIPSSDTLRWALDNKPVTTKQSHCLAEGDFLLKWFNVPLALYDRDLVMSMCGMCNNAVFGHPLAPNGAFPRGTLVFIMPTVEPYRRTTGEIYLNVNYRFRYYPQGANKIYRYNAPQTGISSALGGTETGHGDGFYFATRAINLGDGNGTRAVAESRLSRIPTTNNSPNINVLLAPFADFRNLFRARVSSMSPIPGPTN